MSNLTDEAAVRSPTPPGLGDTRAGRRAGGTTSKITTYTGSVHQPFTLLDLFAGCGGISAGFSASGRFTPIMAVEMNKYAAATYAANFGAENIYCGDIGTWVQGALPKADVVVGGPPCQGFSNLGLKQADDLRNDLWDTYVEALIEIQPKVFLMENVDRFRASKQFTDLWNETLEGRRLENYRLDARILRSVDFGSAQLRKRLIVIGTRKDLPQIFVPGEEVLLPRSQWRTVKEALHDIPAQVPRDHTELPEDRRWEFDQKIAGPFRSDELHITRKYEEQSRERFAEIPYGGNRFDLPDNLKAPCWRKHTTGASDVMGRLVWERPSVTIRTEFFKPEKGRYLHPTEDRAITHFEAARLQGFPDDFLWCGSKVEIARQIGNAVPVELSHAMAEHIGEALLKSATAAKPRTARPRVKVATRSEPERDKRMPRSRAA